jgi:L-amino acid N-acyltransferase YncA
MTESNIKLRFASVDDTELLLEIYRPYIENTFVTLEYDVPSKFEFENRIREYSSEFPYLICEIDGKVAGYAYAHRYKQRFGYRFCAELSIYLAPDICGRGLGRRLYGALIELLYEMGYKGLYGVVVDPNPASFALHKAFGFIETGREHLAGYKFGKWYDVVLFEKLIAPHESCPNAEKWRENPMPIGSIDPTIVKNILLKYSKLIKSGRSYSAPNYLYFSFCLDPSLV